MVEIGKNKSKIRIKIEKLETGKTKTLTSYYDNGLPELAVEIAKLLKERGEKHGKARKKRCI